MGCVWFVTIIEALAMGLAGVAKFRGSRWQELFVIWGYPEWFSYVIGVAEIVGALGLLAPRVAPWAAGFLGVIMTAATATVLAHPGTLPWRASAIHLLLLVFIGVARRPRKG